MLLQYLEGELITDGKLDDAVLALLVTILVNLSQTKVVTTVYHNVIKLVRDAKGNREIESLAIILRSYIHALRRANAINLHVGSQQEARLIKQLEQHIEILEAMQHIDAENPMRSPFPVGVAEPKEQKDSLRV